jgi:MFS family permease
VEEVAATLDAVAGGVELAAPAAPGPRSAVGDQVLGCALLGLLFLTSTAPSPLYSVYQQEWRFSSVMLTVVFAVYSGPLMVALHFSGPFSDRYGRRRLAVGGFTLLLASLLVFAFARGLWWIFAARALQGLGVGTASAALTASVINARRHEATGGATTVAMVSGNIGVGIGALLSGFFVEYVVDPTRTVFVVLACACAIALGACSRVSSARSHHVRRTSWRPRLDLPSASARTSLVYLTGMALAWTLGGLYLSLGPSIAEALGGSSALIGALVAAILGFGGALAAGASGTWAELRQLRVGVPLLVAGLAGVVVACATTSWGIFLAGSAVLACAWGLVYIGTFRALVALSRPETRGATVSVIYVVTYVAFSLPAILAGVCTDAFGLRHTTIAFGSVAALLAVGVGVLLYAGSGRRGDAHLTESRTVAPRAGLTP